MERYNRNIALIGQDGQNKLLSSKILVCGCGGLGSYVVVNLASMGVGTIGLVDDDVVEISNLNRQFLHNVLGEKKVLSFKKWINQFNPSISVNTYDIRLDLSNYTDIVKDYDIIIDCFDSFESKFLLNDIAVKTGKTLIHGGVSEFFGQVTVIKPNTPCLRCLFDYEKNDVPKGIISPIVSVIASYQSMEAAKQILSLSSPLEGILLTYDGIKNEFRKLKINKRNDCICSKL